MRVNQIRSIGRQVSTQGKRTKDIGEKVEGQRTRHTRSAPNAYYKLHQVRQRIIQSVSGTQNKGALGVGGEFSNKRNI